MSQNYNIHHSNNTHDRVGNRWWSIDNTDLSREVAISTVSLSEKERDRSKKGAQWETRVFGGPRSGEGLRYSSAEAASVGHKTAVAFLKGEMTSAPAGWRRLS